MVILDGTNVNVSGLYAKTDFFNVTYPANPLDIYGVIQPGTYIAKASGYFLFLYDLSLGKHEIRLHVVDKLKGNLGFEQTKDVDYEIYVK
jgi:hypothetical protein